MEPFAHAATSALRGVGLIASCSSSCKWAFKTLTRTITCASSSSCSFRQNRTNLYIPAATNSASSSSSSSSMSSSSLFSTFTNNNCKAGVGAACKSGTATASSSSSSPCCWSCGSCVNKSALVCGTCAYIQPMDDLNVNYFDLLSVPHSFDIETKALDTSFKQLQRVAHPDVYATKSAQEQEASASASSKLNVAYQILRNPASRAQYLLKLQGIDAIGETVSSNNSNNSTGSNSNNNASVSPMLLMQVMEARELIEDPTTSLPELVRLKEKNTVAVTACVADLSTAFKKGDYQQAKAITVALQYYSKIAGEVTEVLEVRLDAAETKAKREKGQ